MNKFEVGDRFVFHSLMAQSFTRLKFTVIDIKGDMVIGADANNYLFNFHYTNIRRLKPKAPLKRIWINEEAFKEENIYRDAAADFLQVSPMIFLQSVRDEFIEFVEVRRKK